MEKKDAKQVLQIVRDGGGAEEAGALNLGQRVRDLRKGCGCALE